MTNISELERLKLILNTTTEGWWEWDVVTNVTYHSPQWYEMLGYTETEFNSSVDAWLNLVHEEERQFVFFQQVELMQKQDQWTLEFKMQHKSGHFIDILSRGKVMERNEVGEPSKVVGIHLDITRKKCLEEENQYLQAEVERMSELIDRISYQNSHNLRAPIATILGIIQLLDSEEDSISKSEYSLLNLLKQTFVKFDQVIHQFNDLLESDKPD